MLDKMKIFPPKASQRRVDLSQFENCAGEFSVRANFPLAALKADICGAVESTGQTCTGCNDLVQCMCAKDCENAVAAVTAGVHDLLLDSDYPNGPTLWSGDFEATSGRAREHSGYFTLESLDVSVCLMGIMGVSKGDDGWVPKTLWTGAFAPTWDKLSVAFVHGAMQPSSPSIRNGRLSLVLESFKAGASTLDCQEMVQIQQEMECLFSADCGCSNPPCSAKLDSFELTLHKVRPADATLPLEPCTDAVEKAERCKRVTLSPANYYTDTDSFVRALHADIESLHIWFEEDFFHGRCGPHGDEAWLDNFVDTINNT
jgi:hypothetical protein